MKSELHINVRDKSSGSSFGQNNCALQQNRLCGMEEDKEAGGTEVEQPLEGRGH